MKPDMQVVELKTRNHLLVGSNRSYNVYEEDYNDETMEDL